MTAFNLLLPSHQMYGVDFHDAFIPPRTIVKRMPHFVTSKLRGGIRTSAPAFGDDVLHVPNVKAQSEEVLQRSTNIGSWVLHLAPNVLIPIIMRDSKSRSLFGAGTVRAGGRPVAVAVLTICNVNLNCSDPCHLPVGFVPAPNTVRAGMTWGDLLAGILEMLYRMLRSFFEKTAFDMLVFPGLRKGLGRLLGRLMKSIARPFVKPLAAWLGKQIKGYPGISKAIEKYLDVVFGNTGEALEDRIKKALEDDDKTDEERKKEPTFWDEIADPYNDPKHRVFL